jgi:hypothetical protein
MNRFREASGWLALFLAFSVVIVQLIGAIVDVPDHRHAALGLVLLLSCLWNRVLERSPPRRGGIALMALGAVVQLIGIASGSWSIARLGLPIAVVGLALHFGRPPLTTAALSVWLLPLPHGVLSLLGRLGLETHVAGLATGILNTLGAQLSVVGSAIRTPEALLNLVPRDGGWLLMYVLAGLGWYSAARSGLTLRAAAARAARWAACGIPLQVIAMLLAVGALALGWPRLGREWLSQGAWIATAVVGLALEEFRHRRDRA